MSPTYKRLDLPPFFAARKSANKSTDLKEQNTQTEIGPLFLNKWDKTILLTLYRKYFPDQRKAAKGYGQVNLNAASFITAYFNNSPN